MYEYNICSQADNDIFQRQCLAIEKHVPNLKKDPLLIDVDSSLVQVYRVDKSTIHVYNDVSTNAVYVKSDIPLESFFS